MYVRPAVEEFPTCVPGSVFLTDVWLMLDQKLEGKLLVHPTRDGKQLQAGREASRLKRLVGALRYLYRNSALVDCETTLMYRVFNDGFPGPIRPPKKWLVSMVAGHRRAQLRPAC